MSLEIKICGLSTAETLEASLGAGADMVGMVFFAPSPRHVDLATAAVLGAQARGRAQIVALTVDADDATLAAILDALRPDMFQLHGHETPARVAAIKARFGLPVMKALGIAAREDLAALPAFEAVADRLLLDAKPPKGAALPGGNGVTFDWNLLAGLDLARPFMLSGGLDPENVASAVRLIHPPGLDVSSGVERGPGIKDPSRIEAFLRAARAAEMEGGPGRPTGNTCADATSTGTQPTPPSPARETSPS